MANPELILELRIIFLLLVLQHHLLNRRMPEMGFAGGGDNRVPRVFGDVARTLKAQSKMFFIPCVLPATINLHLENR